MHFNRTQLLHLHSRAQQDKVIGKRHLSRNPSIQGMWSPSSFPELVIEANAARLKAQRNE